MDDHHGKPPTKYSVAEAKSHFSEILARVEAGHEVLITRRGHAVARLSGVDPPRQPPEWDAIDAFRNGLTTSSESAESLIRKLRDAARY